MSDSDRPLVSVFRTTEAGLVPLARIALDQAGIEFTMNDAGADLLQIGAPPSMPPPTSGVDYEIFVNEDDAAQARELLIDLEGGAFDRPAPSDAGAQAASPASAPRPDARIALSEAGATRPFAWITDDQLDALRDHLEEESADDQDYYIDAATLDMLAAEGLDADLVAVLRNVLGSRDGIDIRWDA